MRILAIAAVTALLAGPLVAQGNDSETSDENGKIRHSAPGELRISKGNDSR